MEQTHSTQIESEAVVLVASSDDEVDEVPPSVQRPTDDVGAAANIDNDDFALTAVAKTTTAMDRHTPTETIDLCVSPSTSSNCAPPSNRSAAAQTPTAIEVTSDDDDDDDDDDVAGKANDQSSATASSIECPICLQTCIHPTRLPCGHIFCFLCVKGVAYKNRRCAMCRREIPPEFLDNPHLVNGIQDICKTKATEDGYQWFYEGRNGWWQYDDRTSQDIDEAYKKGEKTCTILVAGYVYVVDFEAMLQQRHNEPSRCRHVKRDLATIPKKGVAGLRIEGNTVATDSNFAFQVYQSTLLGYDSIEAASRAVDAAVGAHGTPHLDRLLMEAALDNGGGNGTRAPPNASDFVSTIAATDAAIRIASDIIGSTLAHADELTRGAAERAAAAANNGEHVTTPQGSGLNTSYVLPTWSARGSRELLGAAEDLLDATQSVIAEADQQTIDLFEQTLNDFHSLTFRNIVDSSDNEEDVAVDDVNAQVRF